MSYHISIHLQMTTENILLQCAYKNYRKVQADICYPKETTYPFIWSTSDGRYIQVYDLRLAQVYYLFERFSLNGQYKHVLYDTVTNDGITFEEMPYYEYNYNTLQESIDMFAFKDETNLLRDVLTPDQFQFYE